MGCSWPFLPSRLTMPVPTSLPSLVMSCLDKVRTLSVVSRSGCIAVASPFLGLGARRRKRRGRVVAKCRPSPTSGWGGSLRKGQSAQEKVVRSQQRTTMFAATTPEDRQRVHASYLGAAAEEDEGDGWPQDGTPTIVSQITPAPTQRPKRHVLTVYPSAKSGEPPAPIQKQTQKPSRQPSEPPALGKRALLLLYDQQREACPQAVGRDCGSHGHSIIFQRQRKRHSESDTVLAIGQKLVAGTRRHGQRRNARVSL